MDAKELSKYLRKMRRFLSRRGRRREEIEDLMQDAFVRLLEYCENGAQVHEPEAVLVRTVQRLALNRDRHEHRDLYVDEQPEDLILNDPGPLPEEILAGEQRLEWAKRKLDAVSHKTREVFFMHRLEGYSYEQIVQQTGMPVRAVETHIARAMTVLLQARCREGHEP